MSQSLYKLDPLDGISFDKTLNKFWDKSFVIVGAVLPPNILRALLKSYKVGNKPTQPKVVLYAHSESITDEKMSLDQRHSIQKILIWSIHQNFYLITVPTNATTSDFAAWLESKLL